MAQQIFSKRLYVLITLIGLCAFLLISIPAAAQTPAPTPDPTLQALQATLSAQQNKIDGLSNKIDLFDSKLEVTRDRINLDINSKFITLIVIAGVLGILGASILTLYYKIDEKIRNKVNTAIDRELFRSDPTLRTIYIHKELVRERKRLEMSGLKRIFWYDDFSKLNQKEITIVPVNSIEDENKFKTFLGTYHPDPFQAAFILYTTGYRVTEETTLAFDNLALANTPTTLVAAVLVVTRGLKSDFTPESEK